MSVSKEQLEHDFGIIVKNSDKNEKLAWVRKKKKLEELVASLDPIQIAILELMAQKQPILDEINELRKIMVKECIHPEDALVHYGKFVQCKFCDKKIHVTVSFSTPTLVSTNGQDS